MAEDGILRYGFHGLSYDYVASALADIAPEVAQGRVVIAHLGHGASMCALHGGKSVATTMGMTALDGLPMGRRCGALDPGVVLYLIEERGMAPAEVREMLYERSGLAGLSGISSEMIELLESDAPDARAAVAFFIYRCRREIGSLAAALGGLDALVLPAVSAKMPPRYGKGFVRTLAGSGSDRPSGQCPRRITDFARGRKGRRLRDSHG